MIHASPDIDGQASPGILTQDCQDTKLPAIMGMMRQEVIGPHMIRILRSETNTRTIIQPQPPALGLTLGYLQSFLMPDPFYPLVIYPPAFYLQ